jgi:hypothetical protein
MSIPAIKGFNPKMKDAALAIAGMIALLSFTIGGVVGTVMLYRSPTNPPLYWVSEGVWLGAWDQCKKHGGVTHVAYFANHKFVALCEDGFRTEPFGVNIQ